MIKHAILSTVARRIKGPVSTRTDAVIAILNIVWILCNKFRYTERLRNVCFGKSGLRVMIIIQDEYYCWIKFYLIVNFLDRIHI